MTHEIDSMAYTGQLPWHGLGERVDAEKSLEEWKKASRLVWDVLEQPVFCKSPMVKGEDHQKEIEIEGLKALVRSDNLSPLSVVSKQYKTIQPNEVLEFYRDLVEIQGFKMDTLGALKGGRKVWALAKVGEDIILPGKDAIRGYLLLTTSYDRTLSTTAMLTSVRVVCNNTLHVAINDKGQKSVKVRHNAFFKADEVKSELGLINNSWSQFNDKVVLLSQKKIRKNTAINWMQEFFEVDGPIEDSTKQIAKGVYDLYFTAGLGSNLTSSKNTLWGLVNAVTEYVDHHRKAKGQDNRLNSSWYGRGAQIKAEAYDSIMKLAA